ncbi:hypothetical protein [Pedobacter sp. Leaf132]|uniref:hypothetical protein n=1 Tax=Pedobacter sp. Leaf132 TaxID=2876557 RepID=UPI001E5C241A|nr:hypothetical protein [Pedobacter sp. Leaf132]
MSSKYKTLFQFENQELVIIEIKRLDLLETATLNEIFHWLYFEKDTKSLIKLWFRSMDSSNEIEERFFEQGYLKFTSTEATYIEKYNSSQHKLKNCGKEALNSEIKASIEDYLKKAY